MKSLLRNTAIHAYSLYLVTLFLAGFKIAGDFFTYVVAGGVLTLMLFIVKPVLQIISFPINILTLGLFSAFTNVIVLYLLTILVPKVSISAFTYEGFSFLGFVIPEISFNTFFAYCICAIILSLIISIINWLIE